MTENSLLPSNVEEKEVEKDPIREEYEKGQEMLIAGELGQAANIFHNVFLAFEERNDEHGMANASDKLGDICFARKDYAKALVHYDMAYTICHKEVDDWSLISLSKKIALARRGLQEYQAAIDIYLDLLDSYQQFKNPAKAVDTLECIADTYVEMGDREKAADALRIAAGIHKNYKHTRHAQDLLNRAEAIVPGVCEGKAEG